ncbi:MAG: asparaginase [Desulfobacula sp. RIFOXYA12_FULL_46_16]|nr:MAG: asparaginase [Bdellovibrionales bacterium RIFOXYB2_FULL_36_6]OGQ90385.1 MAG: asparaginase [Deltaproteobacteria bacterium RIFOXYC2_FULL_48_10]OGR20864.1 MAG: asparaginase [Desulfobacula sp. RIFOXYA12_FULL_46_16]
MKIKFFSVGGTIDKVYFDALSRYEIGDPNIKDILQNARVNFDYEIESLLKKDSLDMTEQDRMIVFKAVQNELNDKIIITHGTDTMIETAAALSSIKGKTIVLTGAMEPAKFKSSDAVFNLGSAVSAVQILPFGVYLAISGKIFTPDNVRKNRDRKQFEEKM